MKWILLGALAAVLTLVLAVLFSRKKAGSGGGDGYVSEAFQGAEEDKQEILGKLQDIEEQRQKDEQANKEEALRRLKRAEEELDHLQDPDELP